MKKNKKIPWLMIISLSHAIGSVFKKLKKKKIFNLKKNFKNLKKKNLKI